MHNSHILALPLHVPSELQSVWADYSAACDVCQANASLNHLSSIVALESELASLGFRFPCPAN